MLVLALTTFAAHAVTIMDAIAVHASHGPDGVSFWIQPPHVAAGFGYNWAGRCAGFYHFFQIQGARP